MYNPFRLRLRTRWVISFFALIVLVLVVRSATLMIGTANRLQSNLAVMNRTPQSFLALGNQIDKLQRITENIDNYNLSDIKGALITTANLASNARLEFQAQYDSWLVVRGEINKDKESFTQLRQRLDEIQRLQDGEIVRLKALLDESTKPSLISDITNLFISFLLGVISSVVASHLYESWKRKRSFGA